MATLVSTEANRTKEIVNALRAAYCFAILFTLLLAVPNAPSAEPSADTQSDNKLIGTWKLVSAKYGGREYNFPEGVTSLKHLTPSQFMWASYDQGGKVTRTAGGDYTLKGNVIEETPRYGLGSDFEVIKGKVQTLNWKVEGNKCYLNGKLSNGRTLEEIWARVDKK